MDEIWSIFWLFMTDEIKRNIMRHVITVCTEFTCLGISKKLDLGDFSKREKDMMLRQYKKYW